MNPIIGVTFRLLVWWFALLFGVVWAYLSFKQQAMYVPPTPIQTFIGLLITGKFFQSCK